MSVFSNREVWFCIFAMHMAQGKTDFTQMMAKYIAVCFEMGINPLSAGEVATLVRHFNLVAEAMERAVDKYGVRQQ